MASSRGPQLNQDGGRKTAVGNQKVLDFQWAQKPKLGYRHKQDHPTTWGSIQHCILGRKDKKERFRLIGFGVRVLLDQSFIPDQQWGVHLFRYLLCVQCARTDSVSSVLLIPPAWCNQPIPSSVKRNFVSNHQFKPANDDGNVGSNFDLQLVLHRISVHFWQLLRRQYQRRPTQ